MVSFSIRTFPTSRRQYDELKRLDGDYVICRYAPRGSITYITFRAEHCLWLDDDDLNAIEEKMVQPKSPPTKRKRPDGKPSPRKSPRKKKRFPRPTQWGL